MRRLRVTRFPERQERKQQNLSRVDWPDNGCAVLLIGGYEMLSLEYKERSRCPESLLNESK